MELQQLLKQCKQKSITAQKYLFDQYAVPMFLVCRRYLKSDQEAEEMVMNGFLKFFNSLDQFVYVNEAATAAWIRKIMVNECLMHLRSTQGFLQVAVDEINEVSIEGNVFEDMSADEIFRLITQLPLGYRTVFNLYVLEDMSHKEIAKILGITEGTSKSQLSKARQMLQQLLIKTNSDYANRRAK